MPESHVHWTVIGLVGILLGGLFVAPAFIAWWTMRKEGFRRV